MATLLSESDFRGKVNIPGTERTEVCEELTRFIEEYEPKFLRDAVGVAFAAEVYTQAALTSGRPEQYDLLILGGTVTDDNGIARHFNGLKWCAARYVFWHWLENLDSLTTMSGSAQPSTDNSTMVGVEAKQIKIWNEMRREIPVLRYFLRYYMVDDAAAFPDYIYTAVCDNAFRAQIPGRL